MQNISKVLLRDLVFSLFSSSFRKSDRTLDNLNRDQVFVGMASDRKLYL
jgi:hypothetical protein